MKALKWITNALLIAAIALVVALFVPRVAGFAPYAVLSGSMEPKYPVGSCVYVQSVNPSTLAVGDDATFRRGDSVITHQVYEVDSDAQQVRTQGIANQGPDGAILHDGEPVDFADIIGKPVACVPYLGYASVWCTTAPGCWIAIAAVVLLVLASGALAKVTEAEDEGSSEPDASAASTLVAVGSEASAESKTTAVGMATSKASPTEVAGTGMSKASLAEATEAGASKVPFAEAEGSARPVDLSVTTGASAMAPKAGGAHRFGGFQEADGTIPARPGARVARHMAAD